MWVTAKEENHFLWIPGWKPVWRWHTLTSLKLIPLSFKGILMVHKLTFGISMKGNTVPIPNSKHQEDGALYRYFIMLSIQAKQSKDVCSLCSKEPCIEGNKRYQQDKSFTVSLKPLFTKNTNREYVWEYGLALLLADVILLSFTCGRCQGRQRK